MDAIARPRTEVTLPSDREIVIAREFNAPRERVFEALTNPAHVKRWYGCGEMDLVACEIDLRVNGAYRHVLRETGGVEHTIKGVYLEIVRPARLVYTEAFVSPNFVSDDAFVTITLDDRGGRTRMTTTVLHQNAANRNVHFNAGVETGAALTMDRLERHLLTMD